MEIRQSSRIGSKRFARSALECGNLLCLIALLPESSGYNEHSKKAQASLRTPRVAREQNSCPPMNRASSEIGL
jgi:hypothetical protein